MVSGNFELQDLLIFLSIVPRRRTTLCSPTNSARSDKAFSIFQSFNLRNLLDFHPTPRHPSSRGPARSALFPRHLWILEHAKNPSSGICRPPSVTFTLVLPSTLEYCKRFCRDHEVPSMLPLYCIGFASRGLSVGDTDVALGGRQ